MKADALKYWKYLEDNHSEMVKDIDKPFTFEQFKQLDKIFSEYLRKQKYDYNHCQSY